MGTGGGGTRVAAVVAAVAIALTGAASAGPGKGKARGHKPVLSSSRTAGLNAHGWYSSASEAAIWVARPADRELDTCTVEHGVTTPDGISTSSSRLEPGILGVECGASTRVTGSRIETLTLRATRWRWTAERTIQLRVDVDDPSVTGSATQAGPSVWFEGTAADGFSGPLEVVLVFTEDAGRHASFEEVPACEDCGHARACTPSACGGTAEWSFERTLPSGSWTVVPFAYDLAGNEIEGEAMHVVVPVTTSFSVARPRIDRR